MSLWCNLFCFRLKFLGYMISQIPTKILVVTSSACYLHVACGYILLACHPYNLHVISTKNISVLFAFGTRYIFCYFCSQYPSSTAALTDVKGVFKSIFHISCSLGHIDLNLKSENKRISNSVLILSDHTLFTQKNFINKIECSLHKKIK